MQNQAFRAPRRAPLRAIARLRPTSAAGATLALLFLALAPIDAARANDTAAALGAGGLKFTRTGAVEMVSEDLFISMDEVRVRYVFHNKSARDVTTKVAFPLPDLKSEMQESPLNLPDASAANFVGFATMVDGKSVPLMVEQKAIFKGRDRTKDLATAGAPLSPLDPSFSAKIAALAAPARADLIKAGLVAPDQIDQGNGPEPYYRPMWDLRTAYYRDQTFPAGRSVLVEHSYRPVVGGTVMAMVSSPDIWKREARRYRRLYCVDSAFEAAGRKLAPEHSQERWIDYVLHTGANWAGPIGSFRLVVDKGDPRNLVSFCGAGVQKIAPTRFEMKVSHFRPSADLHILIVTSLSQ
jgi:hypothetical protein